VYNSTPDTNIYVKFVQDARDYVTNGKVECTKHVRYISHFLSGQALVFYNTTVSRSHMEWSLKRFFWGIFDYCFPKDFHNIQRGEFKRSYQGSLTVREYAYELVVYFEILGNVSDVKQVDKLWNGLCKDIQSELWKTYLDPKSSSWDEVLEVAKIIEKAN
ncbi:hypothetical protein JAAARDRAFT_93262, partial [Jaapia argillacea MUCL 33604]